MKKYLFGLLCSVFLLTGCGTDTELTQVGENFLNLIKENNLDMAYLSTAEEFQESTTLEGLEYTLESYSLQSFESLSWNETKIVDNQGIAVGTLKLPEDKELVVQMSFLNRDSAWQLLSIRFLNPDLAEDETLPNNQEFMTLINDTLRTFIQDLQQKDFSQSYQAASDLWKMEITQDEFREAFQSFIDMPMDWDFVSTIEPEMLNPPQIQQTPNNKIIMTLQGQYDGSTDGKLLFDLKYVKENEIWKLAGINLGYKEYDPNEKTTTKEVIEE